MDVAAYPLHQPVEIEFARVFHQALLVSRVILLQP
jgi:hypothetical protein